MRTKKRFLRLFAALMVCTGAMLLTACVELDNPAWSNPLGDKIYGLWYDDYQESGTTATHIPYNRVVEAVKFNPDGTGMWWKVMLDGDNATKPQAIEGGSYNGTFDYTVAADGTITAKRRASTQSYEIPDPPVLTFRYQDGFLITDGSDASQTLKPAPEGYENMLLAMEKSQYGADADNYNINDKDFTAETWRQEQAIYIYDGVSKDIKDENGNEGYAKVNLPWFNGTVVSNLPMDFCYDITPENGWELVHNSCGMRSMPNGNFFALYNKYLGTLRFFYYMPQGFSTGNDHLWQVTLTQGLADRYDLRYGIPMDKTVSAKDAYGLTPDGNSWADYTTPYVSTMSSDGLITPNAGWWAFDVDLSLYRQENLNLDVEKIRLQMRSWDNSHVSLYSTFKAESKGEFIDLTKASASSSKGLFGNIGNIISTGTSLFKTVASLYSGDLKGGIANGIAFGKSAITLKSLFSGGGNTTPGPTGTISFTTNGTVDTDGVISSSKPTVGIVSPTYLLSSDFDSNATVGQGVWNLKSAPKIYTTNSANTISQFIPDDKKIGKVDKWLVDAANWSFFDPSSVEVVLNPNVFPEDQIEWMQVDAVAGLRTSLGRNEVDSFRVTMGMEPLATKNAVDDQIRWTKDFGSEINDYVFNFVGAEGSPEQTLDLAYPKSIDSGKSGYSVNWQTDIADNYGAVTEYKGTIEQQLTTFGAGSGDDYIIEPQLVFWRDGLADKYIYKSPDKYGIYNWHATIAHQNRADSRNGKSGYDSNFSYKRRFDPNSIYNGEGGYIVGYDNGGKNGFPTLSTPTIDIRLIPVRFPAAEVNVTLTIKLKNMANPIVFSRNYLPEYEYVQVMGNEQAVDNILQRIMSKKNLSPKTVGHTESYDFQAARINKCFKLLTGFSRAEGSIGGTCNGYGEEQQINW